jgi:hypothetical protein
MMFANFVLIINIDIYEKDLCGSSNLLCHTNETLTCCGFFLFILSKHPLMF